MIPRKPGNEPREFSQRTQNALPLSEYHGILGARGSSSFLCSELLPYGFNAASAGQGVYAVHKFLLLCTGHAFLAPGGQKTYTLRQLTIGKSIDYHRIKRFSVRIPDGIQRTGGLTLQVYINKGGRRYIPVCMKELYIIKQKITDNKRYIGSVRWIVRDPPEKPGVFIRFNWSR